MSVHDGGPHAEVADPGRDTVKDFFDRVWRRIQDALRAGGWPAQAILVGAALVSLPSCADARAVTVANAGRLDQVRLGFGLDLDGLVSPGCTASKFALRDPIHLSMKVTDAPAGSMVRVTVRDTVTYRVAWSEERPVPRGASFVTFDIGRGLARGRYRTESMLGGETASPREFVVHERSGDAN